VEKSRFDGVVAGINKKRSVVNNSITRWTRFLRFTPLALRYGRNDEFQLLSAGREVWRDSGGCVMLAAITVMDD